MTDAEKIQYLNGQIKGLHALFMTVYKDVIKNVPGLTDKWDVRHNIKDLRDKMVLNNPGYMNTPEGRGCDAALARVEQQIPLID